ncbi:MAG: hypothetical protein ACTSRZ_01790 [Promethearchaeota archaeon]
MKIVGKIEEIWIILKTGHTIFSQAIDPKFDHDLFGAMLMALNQFAKETTNQECSTIKLGTIKLTIKHCEDLNLMIVARSNIDVKDKIINNYLDKIHSILRSRFKDKLENWNGDLSIFSDLGKYINIKDDKDNFYKILKLEISKKKLEELF